MSVAPDFVALCVLRALGRGEDDTVSGVGEPAKQGTMPPPLPRSIWVVAWSSLTGQALWFVEQGVRLDGAVSLVVSVILGALVFGYVSAGVARARTVRLVLAWVVLVLVLIGELVGLVLVDDLRQAGLAVLSLVTAVLALAGLATFHRTDWFAWQRTKPPAREGAPIAQLIAIGVLVGALGGLIGPIDNGPDVPVGVVDR